jgi:F0F1-type ATP synthase delta subunit
VQQVNLIQKLDKPLQMIVHAIVHAEKKLTAAERTRLQKMLDDAAGNADTGLAETIFGLSAIAGFSIAIEVDNAKKEFQKGVAHGN